jgi:hypothetical protein
MVRFLGIEHARKKKGSIHWKGLKHVESTLSCACFPFASQQFGRPQDVSGLREKPRGFEQYPAPAKMRVAVATT